MDEKHLCLTFSTYYYYFNFMTKILLGLSSQSWSPSPTQTNKQALRQSSVTEGGRKSIWGSTDKFILKFGSEDPKKKVFIPNYAPCLKAVCFLSGHNFHLGENAHSLMGRNKILRCKFLFLPPNSGVKTK